MGLSAILDAVIQQRQSEHDYLQRQFDYGFLVYNFSINSAAVAGEIQYLASILTHVGATTNEVKTALASMVECDFNAIAMMQQTFLPDDTTAQKAFSTLVEAFKDNPWHHGQEIVAAWRIIDSCQDNRMRTLSALMSDIEKVTSILSVLRNIIFCLGLAANSWGLVVLTQVETSASSLPPPPGGATPP